MTTPSPLLARHRAAGALIELYGPPESAIDVPMVMVDADLEYAAIRRGCGLIDLPNRATIEVRGNDRIDFLNRMLTQELKGSSPLAPFTAKRAFWLSRKGRIDADVRLLNLPDRLLLDVDAHAVKRTLDGLSAYVIADDVVLTDVSANTHRLALHGVSATALLAHVAEPRSGSEPSSIAADGVACVRIAASEVIVDREDATGDIGLNLTVPTASVEAVWDALLDAGFPEPAPDPTRAPLPLGRRPSVAPFHLRPIGWAAFNIARIEAGHAIYNLDFGPDSLPHETSLLESRVSFTKGCYLGQEIVARMQSLGSPKKRLVALRLPAAARSTGSDPTAEAHVPVTPQPMTGAALFLPPVSSAGPSLNRAVSPSDCGDPIGAVTSSAISPMLSAAPICLAMLKTAHATAGQSVLVECEGTLLPGTVLPSLCAWTR